MSKQKIIPSCVSGNSYRTMQGKEQVRMGIKPCDRPQVNVHLNIDIIMDDPWIMEFVITLWHHVKVGGLEYQ